VDTDVNSGSVDRHSAFGMFFRKSLVVFQDMSFEQVARLQHNLGEYLTASTGQSGSAGERAADRQVVGLSQINQLIDQEVETVESSRCLLPPTEYQKVLDYLESLAPAALKIHYLSYLNCLRMGEFIGAVDHLHKYFDYFMGSEAARGSLLQYAVLNLAALYSRFGFHQEAVDALNEVIRTARRLNDHECLIQAQHWLYVISKNSV